MLSRRQSVLLMHGSTTDQVLFFNRSCTGKREPRMDGSGQVKILKQNIKTRYQAGSRLQSWKFVCHTKRLEPYPNIHSTALALDVELFRYTSQNLKLEMKLVIPSCEWSWGYTWIVWISTLNPSLKMPEYWVFILYYLGTICKSAIVY